MSLIDMDNPVSVTSEPVRPRNGRGGVVNAHGLTWREESFAIGVAVDGLSKSEAYRRAYDTGKRWTGNSLSSAASKAFYKVKIHKRIQGLLKTREHADWLDGTLARNHIAEQCWRMGGDTQLAAGYRLKALELLGRMSHVAAFSDRSESLSVVMTSDQVQTKIAELTKRIGG